MIHMSMCLFQTSHWFHILMCLFLGKPLVSHYSVSVLDKPLVSVNVSILYKPLVSHFNLSILDKPLFVWTNWVQHMKNKMQLEEQKSKTYVLVLPIVTVDQLNVWYISAALTKAFIHILPVDFDYYKISKLQKSFVICFLYHS